MCIVSQDGLGGILETLVPYTETIMVMVEKDTLTSCFTGILNSSS